MLLERHMPTCTSPCCRRHRRETMGHRCHLTRNQMPAATCQHCAQVLSCMSCRPIWSVCGSMMSRIRVQISKADNEHARRCHLGASGITVEQWIVNVLWLEAIGFHLRDRDGTCLVLRSCSQYCDAQEGLACPFELPRDDTPSAYDTPRHDPGSYCCHCQRRCGTARRLR